MEVTHQSNKFSIINLSSNENINLSINNCYSIKIYYQFDYNIIISYNKFTLNISSIFNDYNSPSLNFLYINDFGNPQNIPHHNNFYNIVYSFDFNYIQGALASIYSLLFNSNFNENICINICTEKNDYELIINSLINFIETYNIKNKFTITLLDSNILDENIYKTKCYKGGNHLLKLSNFTRLLIGHIFNLDYILYLDSDTIIQKDITKCLDKFKLLNNNEIVIWGKKSILGYRNILNMDNYNKVEKDFDYLDFSKNIIYTGTMIIKPILLKNKYNDIISLIQYHNSINGGIYKLFTMSIINIVFHNQINYFDDFLINIVDLGCKKNILNLEYADVLDWSGIYKPWFINGLYKEYWLKYNVLNQNNLITIETTKNTIETFNS
jgi:lipopolysaccharide biosynthesis glycosyltransferase